MITVEKEEGDEAENKTTLPNSILLLPREPSSPLVNPCDIQLPRQMQGIAEHGDSSLQGEE
jgi:hypothetical protein